MANRTRRQHFGQHFLIDHRVIQLITETCWTMCQEFSGAALIEIGPGQGALTLPILAMKEKHQEQFPDFLAIEKDEKIVHWWKRDQENSKLQLIHQDALVWIDSLVSGNEYCVVSNLPYSTGTRILTEIVRKNEQFPAALLMFQKEVGERISASENSKDYGSLSLYVQNYYSVERVEVIKPKSFRPPPKVDSMVVFLRRRKTPWVVNSHLPVVAKKWESFLRELFQQRRRMLRAGFAKQPDRLSVLKALKIDETRRAETLSPTEVIQMFHALSH